MKSTAVGIILSLVLAAGCSDPVGAPQPTRALGIISWDDAPGALAAQAGTGPSGDWGEGNWGTRPALVAPDTVDRGVSFTVVATTAGPNGCWSMGTEEVHTAGRKATITVYDVHSGAEMCTLPFHWFTREIQLRFDEQGDAVVELVGRRVVGEHLDSDDHVVVAKVVFVR